VNIRPAFAHDIAPVRAVLTSAFAREVEADLVDVLRVEDQLVLALVAEEGSRVRGYVAFPRLVISTATGSVDAVGLGPVAVEPSAQRRGMGSAMIEEGLGLLAANDETLVFVLGDPAYYTRFGFEPETAASFGSIYAGPHFMALRLSALAPRAGKVRYPAVFDQLG
jgi:putative acetyltransferase